MVKLVKKDENAAKTEKVKSKKDSENDTNKKENKYEKLTNKKRKLSETQETNKENKDEKIKSKKLNLAKNNKEQTEQQVESQNDNKKAKLNKTIKSKGSIGEKAKFKNGKTSKFSKDKKGDKKAKMSVPSTPAERKELLKKRKQKKLAENYDATVNMKKIWETLRKSETTEETKKKLCSTLYDQVKTRIKQMSFAHDTVRVIECLVQYGTEKHREGVFDELKEDLVEMSKEKYARFLLRKMLAYGSKEQKDAIINAFSGRVTKLIKHSFACQIVESLFNEHASFAQRNQMLMEFYDPTFALLHNQKCKTLSEVLEAQPYSKETILNNIKGILVTCIDKTLLMFSIIHRVFLEFFQNCDQKQKAEMIDLLSEQLVHMIHTKDGASVAMQCIWYSAAKDRKKIIKAMKSFIVKMALEEHGHLVLLAVLDSVDDTKLVSKGILDEMFRSLKEVIENDYGRKILTYIMAPRDSRFFIKDYVKRLEQGDSSETSKKDPEKRRAELFDYSKSALLEYFKKEKANVFYNGGFGILLPIFLDKLGKEGDELTKILADAILENQYEPVEKDSNEKAHLVEESSSHYIMKKLLATSQEKEKKSLLSLSHAILESEKSENISSWIECNRGCFIIVNLLESCNDEDKKKLKEILKDDEKDLKKKTNFQGAKLLLEKLKQI
ncbi:unnamed protein product [Brachionus calyciflorus]|uniref:PUM-HD domain-containing protein n=1 Tax=Brachionus calyciflorus TaxID=104777 RepID=A0A814EA79_9BILA|nr:unnamed protein product [Brachionus calyciflorus]